MSRDFWADLRSKYELICIIIRRAGLAEAVGLDVRDGGTEVRCDESPVPFFRRYPFLEPTPPLNMSRWDELFNATNFGGPATATRDVSPVRHQIPTDRFSASMPNMTYGFPDQLSHASWPTDDFQWLPSTVVPGVAGGNNGQAMHEPSMMGTDHGLLDFSTDVFTHIR